MSEEDDADNILERKNYRHLVTNMYLSIVLSITSKLSDVITFKIVRA